MTYNHNGIPINKKAIISEGKEVYELSFPSGTIKRYNLDRKIDAFAIVQSYKQDLLYILAKTPNCVERQIKKLCGNRMRYNCDLIKQKDAA